MKYEENRETRARQFASSLLMAEERWYALDYYRYVISGPPYPRKPSGLDSAKADQIQSTLDHILEI